MDQYLGGVHPEDIYPSWSRLLPLTLRGLLFPPIAGYYRKSYEKSNSKESLQNSIKYAYAALATTPRNHPSLPHYQQRLAIDLRQRFYRFRDMKDHQLALMLQVSALSAVSASHPGILWHRGALQVSHIDRYRLFDKVEDLDIAISLGLLIVSELPSNSPKLSSCQENLAIAYSDRYKRFGGYEDADAQLKWAQAAVDTCPKGHPGLPSRQNTLGNAFHDMFVQTKELQYLDKALHSVEAAISSTSPTDSIALSVRRFSLAIYHSARYKITRTMDDLQASIDLAHKAITIIPKGHQSFHVFSYNLSVFHYNRHDRLGESQDLEEAIKWAHNALENSSEDSPNRASYAERFSAAIYVRYLQSGSLDDLESALKWCEVAVTKTKNDHPRLAHHQFQFAVMFLGRFRRHRNRVDLDLAFQWARSALTFGSSNDPQHEKRQLLLATLHDDLFLISKNPTDLETSLQLQEPIVQSTRLSHPEAAMRYSGIASTHSRYYKWIGGIPHRTAAMKWYRAALEASSSDDPDRHRYSHNLALEHLNMYNRLREFDDLLLSLEFSNEAVKFIPSDDPRVAKYKHILAGAYAEKYNLLHETGDRDRALECFQSATDTPNSDPAVLWKAVQAWTTFTERCQLPDSVTAYSVAYRILPELFWLGSDMKSKHETLVSMDVAGVTAHAIAACIKYDNLPRAIEFLEQSLALTFQQLLDLRSDLTTLKDQFPGYASMLDGLSLELQKSASSIDDDDKRGGWDRQRKLAIERGTLLKTIRQLPGFENFLLPHPFHSLVPAADFGPVIVLNCSEKRCDAIVMLPGGQLIRIGLPALNSEVVSRQCDILRTALKKFGIHSRETRDMESEYRFGRPRPRKGEDGESVLNSVLSWIWTYIVSHVFKALQVQGVIAGRIWWCPTGPLTYLPLHAAGPPNDFIQSYTSTLGALIRARSSLTPSSRVKVLAVGLSETKSNRLARLPSVKQEIEVVAEAAGKDRVSVVMNQDATIQTISELLPNACWLHLACHGKQGNAKDPLKSGLMLFDDTKLELSTIISTSIPNASFVYLSACETAMGDVDMAGESLHLAGGMVFAGFKAVIGTLWSINDADGPEVAKAVYSHLFHEGGEPNVSETAEALHLAVQDLRKQGVPPHRWVPFIHIGI